MATSSRRNLATRRLGPAGIPACSGVTRSRRREGTRPADLSPRRGPSPRLLPGACSGQGPCRSQDRQGPSSLRTPEGTLLQTIRQLPRAMRPWWRSLTAQFSSPTALRESGADSRSDSWMPAAQPSSEAGVPSRRTDSRPSGVRRLCRLSCPAGRLAAGVLFDVGTNRVVVSLVDQVGLAGALVP
jgi:hypothetical protein